MFKPHSFYIKKKSNESDFDLEAADKAWYKLSDSKLTKFVRKAEKAYDAHVAALDESAQEAEDPFHTWLTIRELELLLKFYGLPSKLPANTRLFYFNKISQNVENMDEENEQSLQYKQLDEKWKSLSEDEKAEYVKEYREAEREYNRSFFRFAKTLPDNRQVDYEHYLDRPALKKPRAPRKSTVKLDDIAEALKEIAELNGEKDKSSTMAGQSGSKNPELKLRHFVPWEIYYEKKKDDFAHLGNTFKAKAKAHSNFVKLSDKKKLKFIKEAESRYDAYEFKTDPKPCLAQYLNKSELKLLLKSYNMPEKVLNPSAQYMKDHIKEASDASASDRMKIVAQKYRNLDEKVKLAFVNKIAEETKKYEEFNKKFLQNLPEARKPDYEFHVKKKPSKSKRLKSSSKKKSKSSNKSDASASQKSKIEPGQQQLIVIDVESPTKNSDSSATPTKRKAVVTNSNSVKQLKLKMFKS